MSEDSEDLHTYSQRPRIAFQYTVPTTIINELPDHQVQRLQTLFPDRYLKQSPHASSSGLPYLESLTDLAVELAFDQILSSRPTPSLVYVAGDCPYISAKHPHLVWNIEVPGDDYADSSTVSSCTHHLREHCECAGTAPDAYLFSHSLYYYSLVEIARALYVSRDKYAFSVHHPFRGAVGSLGFGEVQFEVSHGRVSTTRFPSFERSDLNWLYTKNYIELYQSAPNTNEQLHLYEISSTRVTWTLSWKIVFDSDDIQVVRFGLSLEKPTKKRPALHEPTIKSLKDGKLAYGHLRAQTGLHVEQIWDQLALYQAGSGRKLYNVKQLQEELRTEPDISTALAKLRGGEGKLVPSQL